MKLVATGAALLAAMLCGQALAGEPSAVSASSASTASSATQAAKSEVRAWLEKAEAAAERIEDKKSREWALEMIACSCLDLLEVDKAKEIVAKLPEQERKGILSMIPVPLAKAGRIDEAVREAEEVNTPMAWSMVAGICSRKDVPRALKLLEKVPEGGRGWAEGEIVKNQVLQGDLQGAARTVAKIKDDDTRNSAKAWLEAGRLFQNLVSPDKFVAAEQIDQETREWSFHHIAEMAELKVEAGDLKNAEQILSVLKFSHDRSGVHVALAKYYLKQKQTKEYQAAIDEAFKEASKIGDPEHNGWGNIQSAGRFLEIANLQVQAGQFDAAMKSIGLADSNGNAESKQWQNLGVKSGGIFNALGGKTALIGLLIEAGKVDEAVKAAKQDDGTIMPKAVPFLVEAYAAKGNVKEQAELMKLAKSPEVEYKLCLAAARGAAKKSGLIPADDSVK